MRAIHTFSGKVVSLLIAGIFLFGFSVYASHGDNFATDPEVSVAPAPCITGSITLVPYNGAHFLPFLDPYTFYFGTTQWKRICAKVTGATGPLTYTWGLIKSNPYGIGELKGNLTSSCIYLYQPCDDVKIWVEAYDVGSGCEYMDTIDIAVDWTYYCGSTSISCICPTSPPNEWCGPIDYKLWVCYYDALNQVYIDTCMKFKYAKMHIKAGTATLGACLTPKTNYVFETGVSVYPNPNDGRFTIEHIGDEVGLAHIAVYDLNGRRVFYKDVQLVPGALYFDVGLSDLTNGIYILHFTSDKTVMTEKIQILK